MKYIALLLFTSMGILVFSQQTNSLNGVYKIEKEGITQLWLFVDGYSSLTQFKEDRYISSMGEPFQMKDNQLLVSVEFNDQDSDKVGTKEIYNLNFKEGNFSDSKGNLWQKQLPEPQSLDGAWKISGRMVDGTLQEIHQKGERKTLKLLVGGYFQWFAIDPSQKSFSGTGGGTYTFENGKYTETIRFFSRDNSRVGASLEFDGELKDGQWHHRGSSSKGDPIYEIWSRN